jgi:predicted alpha/beta hydrolase family esterase
MSNKEKTIIIMHGTMGTPQKNWFPWLKIALENLGHTVKSPPFPTPENQTIPTWLYILDQQVTKWDESVILVGHSSACLAICAKLQQLKTPIAGAFLVAPFYGDNGDEEYDRYNRAFNTYQYNWDKVRNGAKTIEIFRSNDDPYVPERTGRLLAEFLKVPEKIIRNGKHLNDEPNSGYNTFPLLLQEIKKIL